jgi:hypothetical protein
MFGRTVVGNIGYSGIFSEESSPEADAKTKVRGRFLGDIYRKLMQLLPFTLACYYSPSTPSSGRKCARATNQIGGPIKRATNYKDHQEGDQ